MSAYGKTVTSLNVELRGTIIIRANNTNRSRILLSFTKSEDVKVTGNKVHEKVKIPVPLDISLSCSGSLITLVYTVVVTPKIDSCCCITTNEPLSIKVVINPTS